MQVVLFKRLSRRRPVALEFVHEPLKFAPAFADKPSRSVGIGRADCSAHRVVVPCR